MTNCQSRKCLLNSKCNSQNRPFRSGSKWISNLVSEESHSKWIGNFVSDESSSNWIRHQHNNIESIAYASNPKRINSDKRAEMDPNWIGHYVSVKSLKQLEIMQNIERLKMHLLEPDFSVVKFYLWTPEKGLDNPFEFTRSVSKEELSNHNFNPLRPTKIICHHWRGHAQKFAKNFIESKNNFFISICVLDLDLIGRKTRRNFEISPPTHQRGMLT